MSCNLNCSSNYSGFMLTKTRLRRITYQDADDARLASVKRIEAICGRHRAEAGSAALQFSMCDARVLATIAGVSRPERVAQTIAWANSTLSEAVSMELTELGYETTDPEAERHYTPE